MKMDTWTDEAISDFGQRRFHAYPHCNGFADGGKSIVVGQREAEGVSLWKVELGSGAERMIRRFASGGGGYDVAIETNTMAVVGDGGLWLLDLGEGGEGRMVVREPAGMTFDGLPSITADGTRAAVMGSVTKEDNALLLVDLRDGSWREAARFGWWANHVQFSPHDPAWVGLAHEGWVDLVPDRVWAWHAQQAPGGRCIFDQASAVPGTLLRVGHEMWCWHDTSALVVAYGSSAAGPRGLYELYPDGRKPRLVSEGNRDWHCSASRCGQWALLDSSGPHDLVGPGTESTRNVSDIVLVNMGTGARSFVARTRCANHPWHPHPVFSPDGEWIVYSEAGSTSEPSGRVHVLKRTKQHG